MPFTPPSTYASKANTAYEATVALGSPPVAFMEVKTFSIDYASIPEVPTTHLLSVNNTEEFSPGMIKPGKITVGGSWIGSSDQLAITTKMQAQTIGAWVITFPVQQGAKTEVDAGTGFIVGLKNGPFENNKAIEFQLEIQMTGAWTQTVS